MWSLLNFGGERLMEHSSSTSLGTSHGLTCPEVMTVPFAWIAALNLNSEFEESSSSPSSSSRSRSFRNQTNRTN